MEVEAGIMQPQPRNTQHHQKLEDPILYCTWRECGPDNTFISDLEPPQFNEFVIASHQVCGNLLQQL